RADRTPGWCRAGGTCLTVRTPAGRSLPFSSIVVQDRAEAAVLGEDRIAAVAEQVEVERLVGLLLSVALDFDGDGLGRLAGVEGQRAGPGDFLFSLRENAIAKEPGRAILSAGGVCLDSVLQWWLRLHRVFPVGDSEPGSVFGPITGDPAPVTPSRG